MSPTMLVFFAIVLTVSTVGSSSSNNNKNSTTSESGKGVRKTIADRWNAGYHDHQHHPRRLQKSPSNGCAENQIRFRRECYNKTSLFSPCQVKEQCQSMVAHSYCGFPEREDGSLDRHQCICDEGYRPKKDMDITKETVYYCTPIHECSTEHYNADHLPGNCPQEHEFCARNICLCAPNYRRDSASFDCLWAVPDRPEPGTGYVHLQWWNLNAATIVIIILAVAYLIVGTIVSIMFCCPQAKLTTITTTSAEPNRNSFISNPGQKTYRQNSVTRYNLLSDNNS